MATKQPSNNDLYKLLGKLDQKTDEIHDQVKYTNGRVTKLETAQIKADVLAEYIDKHGLNAPAEAKEAWTTREKQLIAFITALLAILGTLVGTGAL